MPSILYFLIPIIILSFLSVVYLALKRLNNSVNLNIQKNKQVPLDSFTKENIELEKLKHQIADLANQLEITRTESNENKIRTETLSKIVNLSVQGSFKNEGKQLLPTLRFVHGAFDTSGILGHIIRKDDLYNKLFNTKIYRGFGYASANELQKKHRIDYSRVVFINNSRIEYDDKKHTKDNNQIVNNLSYSNN